MADVPRESSDCTYSIKYMILIFRREFEGREEALIDMWNGGWDAVEGNGTKILARVRYK